jgi:hypothetical protein
MRSLTVKHSAAAVGKATLAAQAYSEASSPYCSHRVIQNIGLCDGTMKFHALKELDHHANLNAAATYRVDSYNIDVTAKIE